MASKDTRIVIVTCASLGEARRIGRAVVEKRLAACANILRVPVESVYWWKGKVEKAREVMVLLKTTAGRLKKLESEVRRLHSYEVAEFVAVPIVAGSQEYLRWVRGNVKEVQ